MPARKKMTPVEGMIIFAILGILASIALPAMNQAQRRARYTQRSVHQQRAPAPAASSDGQLNTIEVSKLSQSAERAHPERWFGVIIGLLPVVAGIAFIYVIIKRVREQMTRRAH